MSTRVVIADDHPMLLDGLKSVLEKMEGILVLATVQNGHQLIDSLQLHAPDIILLDLNMPRLNGIETLRILKKKFPGIRVLILTSYQQPELIREIKQMGASGYLLKNSSEYVLKEAIEFIVSGGTWFRETELPEPAAVLPYFIDDFMKKYQLTRREVEIIRLISNGHTSREIGASLFVSEFTINAHRRNISRKLNIHSPVGLLKFAKEQGIA